MPKNFTDHQRDLVDAIALSLEQLDSVLYLVTQQLENDFHLINQIKSIHIPIDQRVQSALYLACDLFQQTKDNFDKLGEI